MTVAPSVDARSSIAAAACVTAFSTRLRTSRRSSPGSPTTGAAETCDVSTSGPPSRRTRAASSSTTSSRSRGWRVRGRSSSVTTNSRSPTSASISSTCAEEVAVELLVVDGTGAGHGHLQLGPLRGERAAQVVGDVGHEPALPLLGLLERAEHPVHRAARRPTSSAGRRRPHPPREVVLGDGVDLGADPVEPAQRPPDQQPRRGDEEQPDQGYADPQPRPQARGRLADGLQAGADVDADPAAVGRGSGGGPQPVRPRSRRRRDRRRPRRWRPPVVGLVGERAGARRRWGTRRRPGPRRRRPGPPRRR